jgi:hypothetical protein
VTLAAVTTSNTNASKFAYLSYVASLQVADLFFGLAVAVLVALGFRYPVAWAIAMVLIVGGGLHISKRQKIANRRFHCSDCGIDYPNDMVQRT